MGQPVGWRAKQAEEGKKGEAAGKRGHEAPLGAARVSEKKGPSGYQGRLRRCQTKRGSKACWNAEQLDGDWPSRCTARIASEPLLPGETRVRALRARQDHVRGAWRSGTVRQQSDLDALVSHELDTGAPVLPPAPIAPEHRCGTHPERMEQHTHLARLRGGAAVPLALLVASGQERHWRMLAPYTTRRLPSASRRDSCAVSFWLAGQRRVPSGWRAKSCPEKRPALKAVAPVGLP